MPLMTIEMWVHYRNCTITSKNYYFIAKEDTYLHQQQLIIMKVHCCTHLHQPDIISNVHNMESIWQKTVYHAGNMLWLPKRNGRFNNHKMVCFSSSIIDTITIIKIWIETIDIPVVHQPCGRMNLLSIKTMHLKMHSLKRGYIEREPGQM